MSSSYSLNNNSYGNRNTEDDTSTLTIKPRKGLVLLAWLLPASFSILLLGEIIILGVTIGTDNSNVVIDNPPTAIAVGVFLIVGLLFGIWVVRFLQNGIQKNQLTIVHDVLTLTTATSHKTIRLNQLTSVSLRSSWAAGFGAAITRKFTLFMKDTEGADCALVLSIYSSRDIEHLGNSLMPYIVKPGVNTDAATLEFFKPFDTSRLFYTKLVMAMATGGVFILIMSFMPISLGLKFGCALFGVMYIAVNALMIIRPKQ